MESGKNLLMMVDIKTMNIGSSGRRL